MTSTATWDRLPIPHPSPSRPYGGQEDNARSIDLYRRLDSPPSTTHHKVAEHSPSRWICEDKKECPKSRLAYS